MHLHSLSHTHTVGMDGGTKGHVNACKYSQYNLLLPTEIVTSSKVNKHRVESSTDAWSYLWLHTEMRLLQGPGWRSERSHKHILALTP